MRAKILCAIERSPLLVRLLQNAYNRISKKGNLVDLGNQLSVLHNKIHLQGVGNKLQFGKNNKVRENQIWVNGNDNTVVFGADVQMYGTTNQQSIHIEGSRNRIIVEDGSTLRFVNLFIWGNDNCIRIGKNCSVTLTGIHMEQSKNSCIIAAGNTMHGRDYKMVQFELDEGTRIFVDEDCMISNDVVFRSSDSHSIVDENGSRTNHAQNITVGKHCWIGMRSMIMKGVSVPDHSVIAAGSIVTKTISEPNVVIAGVPARAVKYGIDWDRKFVDNIQRTQQ